MKGFIESSGHVEVINYDENIIEYSFKSQRIYHTQNWKQLWDIEL